MAFCSKCVLFLSVFYSALTWSSVTVEFGDNVILLAINGESVEGEDLDNTSNAILPNGINQLVVQYEAEIKITSNEYEIENSKSYVFVFNVVDQNLTLSAPRISTLRELERFNIEGDWQLSDKSNQVVKYKADILKKDGFQLNRDYKRELEEFNLTNSPAAIRFKSRSYKGSIDRSQSGQSDQSEIAAKMLVYWYMKADEVTRETFKSWINR